MKRKILGLICTAFIGVMLTSCDNTSSNNPEPSPTDETTQIDDSDTTGSNTNNGTTTQNDITGSYEIESFVEYDQYNDKPELQNGLNSVIGTIWLFKSDGTHEWKVGTNVYASGTYNKETLKYSATVNNTIMEYGFQLDGEKMIIEIPIESIIVHANMKKVTE